MHPVKEIEANDIWTYYIFLYVILLFMIKYISFINREIKRLLLIDAEEQYWGAPRYLYSRSAAVNLGRQEKKRLVINITSRRARFLSVMEESRGRRNHQEAARGFSRRRAPSDLERDEERVGDKEREEKYIEGV